MDELQDIDQKDLLEFDDGYIQAATSDNTRRAYQADIEHFEKMGGQLPATPESVVTYLRQCATSHNPRTLVRRLTAIRQWHKLQGVTDPTQSPLVIKTMRGIAHVFMAGLNDKHRLCV